MIWEEMSYNQRTLTQNQRLETEPEELFKYNWLDEIQEALDNENLDYFSLGR